MVGKFSMKPNLIPNNFGSLFELNTKFTQSAF